MADDGWRCPKADKAKWRKRRASEISPSPIYEPPSPPIYRQFWPTDSPILPRRLESPKPEPLPSTVGCTRQLFPGPNFGVSRRPLATMSSRSGEPAGGDETPQLAIVPYSSPIYTTPSLAACSQTEELSPPLESCSLPPFPFEMVGDTWEQCVADADAEMQIWEKNWDEANH